MVEIKTTPSGIIQPFMFDNMPIRGMVLRINNISDHLPNFNKSKGFIDKALAEMLIASAVLTYDLKKEANITLQIQSSGNIPLMVAQCDKDGSLRAYAKINEDCKEENLTYKELTKDDALFAVSIEQGEGKNKNLYQSIIGLNDTSVSSSIEQYFNDSVQLNTYFKVIVSEVNNKLSCGCIFMQALPQEDTKQDDWRRMAIIISTIKENELLPGKISETELLTRLFAEDKVRVFQPHDLNFASPRTRERMINALKSLGEDQCKKLLKDGSIVMTCEFSGKEEKFSTKDISNIFDTEQNED